MKTKPLFLLVLATTAAFTACKKNDPEPENTPTVETTYTNGVFITNEGQYGSGTGTISFFNRSNSAVSNDIFNAKNNYPLGNVVQSMTIHNNKGYIVVNNGGKIEIVDASSFASAGVIHGLNNPRYFLGINDSKGYVSEWGADGVTGRIKVIDLVTKAVIDSITTGLGAEQMVLLDDKVYVACSGGYGNDSVVTVIDASTNAVLSNINVGANPKYLKVDANGKIWVLCSGQYDMTYTSLEKTGKLQRINPSTNSVELTLNFSSTTSQPSNLVIDNTKTMLYYNYSGKIYGQSDTSGTLSSTATINRSFYGLGIDPTNNYFFCSDAGNFSSEGKVVRYNATGVVVDSFTVGIIPGNFCFK